MVNIQTTARVRQSTRVDVDDLAHLRWQSTIEEHDVAEPSGTAGQRMQLLMEHKSEVSVRDKPVEGSAQALYDCRA